ncbi:MAG: DUF4335 domain-containing protein [Nodosilinea sp.]
MAPTATITSYEYTAGTCTLRLVGELSPLSQVTSCPVLGRSRFTLQVHGDAAPGETRAAANQAVIFEISGREPQFSALADLVQTYVLLQLSADALATGEAVDRGENTLQPVGLTRHRLTLATPPAPPRVVDLSTLQLSDLAEALEQADDKLQIIPDGSLPKPRPKRPQLPLWLGSVAAVGIAALLGNQFLTTAPSPVVFSPNGSPIGESQTFNGATAESPADSRQQGPEESAPTADASTETGAATGEAVPAPTTTAPTTPSAPSEEVAEPGTAKTSPQLVPVSPAPAARPPQAATTPAPAHPQARGGQAASPDADIANGQFPDAARPDTLRPAAPEAFDSGPGIAASRAPDSALGWIATLTLTLQEQWRSPANLAAPLRYRITLEPDGTVTTLEPLNDFSATYQNSSSLPQPGDTLPGVVRDESTTVEVQFLPSGEVVVVPPVEANP